MTDGWPYLWKHQVEVHRLCGLSKAFRRSSEASTAWWPYEYSMAVWGWGSLDCVDSVKPSPDRLRPVRVWWPHDCVSSPVSWLCGGSKYTGTSPSCRTRTCGAVPGRACICKSGCRFCTCNWIQTLLSLYVLKNTCEYSNYGRSVVGTLINVNAIDLSTFLIAKQSLVSQKLQDCYLRFKCL